ncbi:DUF4372 domain-containing protein [Aquiflexum sp. LQ15W]|uniref:DUF4372 domain-containing protein n=1 Tax=Cognataquiflexum nitidum TaxID=2922272 RepID=UPI001F136FEB|nr:DUF4372 domain-containing protein [Cognataquiflexum nitidum]MCH6200812.1 DUF4372 domain-containing protein [Cognataquiflexum nitidum]
MSGHPTIAKLLSLIPKEIFNEVVEQENSDRYYKKLKSADHSTMVMVAAKNLCSYVSLEKFPVNSGAYW